MFPCLHVSLFTFYLSPCLHVSLSTFYLFPCLHVSLSTLYLSPCLLISSLIQKQPAHFIRKARCRFLEFDHCTFDGGLHGVVEFETLLG